MIINKVFKAAIKSFTLFGLIESGFSFFTIIAFYNGEHR